MLRKKTPYDIIEVIGRILMSREELLSAVYMIIKNERGEVLFQRRWGSKLWLHFLGLPAGHVDKGGRCLGGFN